jgi:hypothetical protein
MHWAMLFAVMQYGTYTLAACSMCVNGGVDYAFSFAGKYYCDMPDVVDNIMLSMNDNVLAVREFTLLAAVTPL